MRRTITLLAATAALAAGITGSASAATLYTTSAHTTPVAVGATFYIATNPSGSTYYTYTSTNAFASLCQQVRLRFTVVQNSGGVFKANALGSSGPQDGYNTCSIGWTAVNPVGALQISGSAITVGTNKAWLSTTLSGQQVASGTNYNTSFPSATGNPPAHGVWAQQPTTGGAPLSVVLDHASTGSAVSWFNNVSVTYTIWADPVATAYSLG
jgi:hypothetical protein